VFWGAAIVFFLAKFINFHNANTQGFWVEVSSQVVCGTSFTFCMEDSPSDTSRYRSIYCDKCRIYSLPRAIDMADREDLEIQEINDQETESCWPTPAA
jgi:hypothetical protein